MTRIKIDYVINFVKFIVSEKLKPEHLSHSKISMTY